MRYQFVLVILLSVKMYAYEHDFHGSITNLAFNLIQRCEVPLTISSEQVQILAKGTVDEDTTEPEVRLRNWHFYNTYGNLRQGPLMYESLDHVFMYRNQQLQKQREQKNNLTKLTHTQGRVLHYIQDMYVPSHVVPVFHGGLVGDEDHFDHYDYSQEEQIQLVQSMSCDELKNKATSYFQFKNQNGLSYAAINKSILDQSAQWTLQQVRSSINSSSLTWQLFWQEPEEKSCNIFDTPSELIALGISSKRFGSYGYEFGKNIVLNSENEQNVVIDKKVYDDFFRHQLKGAILASAIFIVLNN